MQHGPCRQIPRGVSLGGSARTPAAWPPSAPLAAGTTLQTCRVIGAVAPNEQLSKIVGMGSGDGGLPGILEDAVLTSEPVDISLLSNVSSALCFLARQPEALAYLLRGSQGPRRRHCSLPRLCSPS